MSETLAGADPSSPDPELGFTPAVSDREFILLMALLSALSALAIDMLLPGFSQMRDDFGLSSGSNDLAATITVFFVGSGIGNLVYGPLTDAWGRKPVLLASLALYGTAALASALAPSLSVLLVARFVWGFGAGGPRVLTQAIVRDRYAGTAMARVMSLVQAAFFLAPVIAPLMGAGLAAIGGWRWIMGFGLILAVVTALWSTRLAETLPPTRRRPLTPRSVTSGFGLVLSTPSTLLLGLSVTFVSGAFFSFLSSSELMFSDIFGRGEWFVPYFSSMAFLLGLFSFGVNRLLQTMAPERLTLFAGVSLVVLAGVRLALALNYDGVPPFALWLALFSLSNLCIIAIFPSLNSLALEPMGALAGTAASVLGFLSSVGGAILATITDRALAGSVTPVATAYLVYGAIALVLQVGGLRRRPADLAS